MPIQVEIVKENRVVLQTYSDPLDTKQMVALAQKMEGEILPSAVNKLHIIADFRAVKNLPGTVLSSGTSLLRSPHVNTGIIIFVTSSGFVSSMARVFSSLVPKHTFKVMRSLEEAYAEIDALLEAEVH